MRKVLRQICVLFLFLPVICFATQWPVAPTNISTPGVNASEQQIAIDPNGNIVAVWIENTIVKSSAATVNGGWSSNIATLSGSGASEPQVKIDLNGTATAIWVENGIVTRSSCPLNGSWTGSIALSSSGASAPELAIDLSGNLVAVWTEGGLIQSSTQLVGGSWSVSPDTISSAGASSPQVAISSNGTVIAVWQGVIGSTPTVYAASKSINGSWGAEVAVSLANVNSSYPQVAIDSLGNATCIWFSYTLTGSVYSNVILQSSLLSSGGSWSTPVNISASGFKNPADLVSCVAMGPNQTAVAAWTNSYDGSYFSCEWNIFSDGNWSVPVRNVNQNLLAYSLDLCSIPKGDVFQVWMSYDPIEEYLSVQGAVNDLSSLSKVFFNSWTMSNSNENGYPVVASNSLDSNLFLAMAWMSFDSANNIIQATQSSFAFTEPPSGLGVVPQVNNFGVTSEISNILSWTASPSSNLLNYLIFRDGLFLGYVDSNTLQFIDPNRTVGETVTYSVASSDSQGCQSALVSINFTN